MKKAVLLLSVFFLLVGYKQEIEVPTRIEKIDLKLMGEDLAFTFLNLPEGEATLVQNHFGEAILINTGASQSQEKLRNYLNLYSVTSIKAVIITKLGPEYDGNFNWLSSQYGVGKVIVPAIVSKSEFPSSIPIEKWSAGDQKELLQGLNINVLQVDGTEKAMHLSLKFGKHRFLFMSIANSQIEEGLIKNHQLRDVNILKVAEFANNKGTSQELLDAVDPQIAIIFKKKNIPPSADVIERLQSTWIDIYYTKQFGNITIKCNKDQYEVITITLESLKAF